MQFGDVVGSLQFVVVFIVPRISSIVLLIQLLFRIELRIVQLIVGERVLVLKVVEFSELEA